MLPLVTQRPTVHTSQNAEYNISQIGRHIYNIYTMQSDCINNFNYVMGLDYITQTEQHAPVDSAAFMSKCALKCIPTTIISVNCCAYLYQTTFQNN